MTPEEHARAAESIERVVADGQVSREHADIRLGEMRSVMGNEKIEGIVPRLIPEEEYLCVSAELQRLVEKGELSQEAADRGIREMQIANTMAHVEAAVESGETTRAEADKLYEQLGAIRAGH